METEPLPTLPTFVFEPNWKGVISMAIAFLLPVLIGLLTRPTTPGIVKGSGLIVLAGVKSILEAAFAGGVDFNLSRLLWTTGVNVGAALIAYFTLIKPQTASGASIRSWAARTLVKPRPRRMH